MRKKSAKQCQFFIKKKNVQTKCQKSVKNV